MRTFNATPKASMLIESLRDIGYSLETALADIVDNSISANAKKICIFADTSDSNNFRIGVLDNGEGMTEDELHVAMRPGSRNPIEERPLSELGRFGLGLKTASFSQCRRLTVVTRKDKITSAAIWDLDEVAQMDDWIVQIPDSPSSIHWAEKLGEEGTLVVWEKLDRLINHGSGDKIRSFTKRIDDTCEHLELVFHRFLSGERGFKRVDILLNERPLVPFDPFNSRHPATTVGPIEKIKLGEHEVVIQPFTLPHHQKVTREEWDRHGGRSGYQKMQGFYVYRERRLIIHGTWFGLARQMELTKLSRVRIDMPNGLDAEWKIDVKKASAQPPFHVRDRLRKIIGAIGASSKRVYTSRGQKLPTDGRLPVWHRIQNKGSIIYRINDKHPVFADFINRLPEEIRNDFSKIVELVGSTLPMDAIYADFGGTPEQVSGNMTSEATFLHAFQTTVGHLIASNYHLDQIKDMLHMNEPFCSNWPLTEQLLNEYSQGDDKNDQST